ncbi:hypothetical protein ABZ477_16105 [Microbacterium sp. NPDC019599]|uniref:hypothetical protein n=1 Tax=Microbacterium sp. NPDC019599 TaxID=3154690 RepID=UPI00340AB32B
MSISDAPSVRDSSALWRIDALDARGGICFASKRSADLLGTEIDLDRPAVWLAAPDFVPRRLASRAPAMAATRGTFQLGVFIRDSELSFTDLDHLAEFVRRVYLARGGDNPEGPSAAGAPTEGPPPTAPGPLPESAFSSRLLELGSRWNAESRGLGGGDGKGGETAPFSVEVPLFSPPLPEDERVREWRAVAVELARGFARIAAEMVARGPADRDPTSYGGWLRSLRKLAAAALKLGVWDTLDRGEAWPDDSTLFSWAGERYLAAHDIPGQPGTSVTSDPMEKVRYLLTGLLDGTRRELSSAGLSFELAVGGREDPYEDLRRWPLPADRALRAGMDPAVATVATLLSRAVSTPGILSGTDATDRAILIFAICHLQPRPVSSGAHAPGQGGWPGPDIETLTDLVEHSWGWLRRELPTIVFTPDVEALVPASREEEDGDKEGARAVAAS